MVIYDFCVGEFYNHMVTTIWGVKIRTCYHDVPLSNHYLSRPRQAHLVPVACASLTHLNVCVSLRMKRITIEEKRAREEETEHLAVVRQCPSLPLLATRPAQHVSVYLQLLLSRDFYPKRLTVLQVLEIIYSPSSKVRLGSLLKGSSAIC